MKIEDFGFVTFVKKYEENSLLIKILSKENGLISGYLRHIKKDRNTYQVGNLVKFTWSAKSTNQLGSFKIELVRSYLSYFVENRFCLYLIDGINYLINNFLYERYLDKNLFKTLENIFNSIVLNNQKFEIIKEYLIFENTLLNIIGTGIIFDENKSLEEFCYISPKTGLAVCKEKGEPYKDKLFIFPKIFKNNSFQKNEIIDSFEIMNFFIKKHLNDSDGNHKYKKVVLLRENIINNL